MSTTGENLGMIQATFNKGLEVLGILRDQLLGERKSVGDRNYDIDDMSPVDKCGRLTFFFTGLQFYARIRVRFRSQRGHNQYAGFIDWGTLTGEDGHQKEKVKTSTEYKWTADRIFLVDSTGDETTSHIIKDEGRVHDCSDILQNCVYNSLPDTLKLKPME